MLVDQVGTKSFTFVMWHTDVVDVEELRAFPPSNPRSKCVHVEGNFKAKMSRAFEFTNDVKVDDHSIGAIIREDIVDPRSVLDGVVAIPVGVAAVGHGILIGIPVRDIVPATLL
eukprot:3973798-Pyramimonas_sp.AAC.1